MESLAAGFALKKTSARPGCVRNSSKLWPGFLIGCTLLWLKRAWGNHMAKKKPKVKRKRTAKRGKPKKRSSRKVVHTPLVSDEALERSYSF
jgi:hypothetical protein